MSTKHDPAVAVGSWDLPVNGSALTTSPWNAAGSPARLERLGSPGAAGVPTSLNELSQSVTRAYDLSITAAADLGIPVAGSVSGGMARRVVVLERAAFKELEADQGFIEQWGYAIRFCLTVSKFDASMKLSLPFLAASAQVGTIEAQWMLQVAGLAGPKIDEASKNPTEFNVETFVEAKQSLEKLISAVRDDSTHFTAARLATRSPKDHLENKLRRAVGVAVGLDAIAERTPMDRVSSRLADTVMVEALRETFQDLNAMASDGTVTPTAASQAGAILGRVRIDPR